VRLSFMPITRVSPRPTLCAAAGLLVALGLLLPAPAAARLTTPPPYALTDVGTFGGPDAGLNGPAIQITSKGAVLGSADTTIADNDFPNFNPFLAPDPFIYHAFEWQNGQLTDLGALPGNNSSAVFEVNGRGVGAGSSETRALDPLTGYPAEHAVLFKDGTVIDLGTLPGGHESQALAINDRGQVAGFGNNGVPDPVSVFNFNDWTTQTRAFIWQDGVMHDLGTLGGPDADLATLNARGQVAGDSYTNSTPNAATGTPTTHPYLWTDGGMRDLGTLGGTSTLTKWLNNRGQVVGESNLAGDQASHPFFWDGEHLRDLGTFGGNFGQANYINDAGDVVGYAALPGSNSAHAFLWRHGVMTDLTGAGSSQCTFAAWTNSHDQIVGGTCDGSDALLWDDGKQYDLNTLVAPSDVHLTEAALIDDRGDIAALGVLPNGSQHVFLLRPTNAELLASNVSNAHHHPLNHRPMNKDRLNRCLARIHAIVGTRLANCRKSAPPSDTARCCG
jgi:probable HAF family extracellular repeat protein